MNTQTHNRPIALPLPIFSDTNHLRVFDCFLSPTSYIRDIKLISGCLLLICSFKFRSAFSHGRGHPSHCWAVVRSRKSRIQLRYLVARRQVGSWSQTCSELEFGL